MDAWREEIMEVAKQIEWIPSYGKDLELDWLKNMRDWMISKKRYWGLALPIWTCDDPACDWFDVVGGRDELERRAVEGWGDFDGNTPHRPWVDGVKIRCEKCGATASRTLDVGNPWLDAGIVPYSTMRYNTDRDYWKKWFPADLVLECFPGQFRNWFYALLAMSTMMENRPPFKTLLGHALVRDEHGQEMHKSTGQRHLVRRGRREDGRRRHALDLLQPGHDVEPQLRLRPGPRGAGQGHQHLLEHLRLLLQLRPPGRVDPLGRGDPLRRAPRDGPLDPLPPPEPGGALRALLPRVQGAARDPRRRRLPREALQLVRAAEPPALLEGRGRGRRPLGLRQPSTAVSTGLNRVVAPIVPFMSEAIYQNMVRGVDESAPASVHHSAFPEVREDWRDERLLQDMDAAQRLTWLGLSAREAGGVKVRQPLPCFHVRPGSEDERSGAMRFAELLKETLNVKEIRVLAEGEDLPVERICKPQFKALGPVFGKQAKGVAEAIKNLDGDAAAAAKSDGADLTITVDGADLTVTPDMYVIEEQRPEGLAMAHDEESVVAVDTRIDEELAREGMMRDLLRRLQNVRKDVGLEMEDRIHVRFHSESAAIATMLHTWQGHMVEELLCTDWRNEETPGADWLEIKMGPESARVLVTKA